MPPATDHQQTLRQQRTARADAAGRPSPGAPKLPSLAPRRVPRSSVARLLHAMARTRPTITSTTKHQGHHRRIGLRVHAHVRRGQDGDAPAQGELARAAHLFWGIRASSRSQSTSIAALACATVTSSRRRAFTSSGANIVGASRRGQVRAIAGSAVIGIHMSVPTPTSTVPR